MKKFIISKQGQALPNRKIMVKDRAEAVKVAKAIFGTTSVSVVQI